MSVGHWIIVLLIVALVFGTKRLRGVGQDLGGAIRDFRAGMQHEESGAAKKDDAAPAAAAAAAAGEPAQQIAARNAADTARRDAR